MPGMKLQLPLGRIVEDQLATYLKALYPPDLPEVQRTELRKLFFAGVTVTLGVLELIGNDDTIDEEDGGRILESIRDECMRFAQGLPANKPEPFIWTPDRPGNLS